MKEFSSLVCSSWPFT